MSMHTYEANVSTLVFCFTYKKLEENTALYSKPYHEASPKENLSLELMVAELTGNQFTWCKQPIQLLNVWYSRSMCTYEANISLLAFCFTYEIRGEYSPI